ncbi:hypothetical protein LCGC14_2169580 [marine sediment metagenome]|uniref:Uncharacterized protein n=1 Tax=marine sediment metagenome TaxID=412755 RepID=A0A0F9G347_9ZZZZ
MSQGRRIGLLVTACVLVLHGCEEPPPAKSSPKPAPAFAHTTSAPSTQPIVEMWNGGIYLAGIKPFLLFTAWEDGTVLVRRPVEPRTAPHRQQLFVGKASRADIEDLLKISQKAGFFDPPIKGPLLYVDGPEFIITIRYRGKENTLTYHGGDPKLDQIGPNASPSRAKMEAFHKLWAAVRAAIKRVPVTGLSEFKGQPPTFKR